MSDEVLKYDVAISFLYQDLNLAKALHDELNESLDVFFFPRNQEELAGTDGLESMRAAFRYESRLNVVLYRPKWGKTPWTGVEEIAIKESCLQSGFRNLFFLIIEPTQDLPAWLPETHIRFNYSDFSLEQAIGAIKARVKERGGQFKQMTPMRKAELLKTEDEFRQEREYRLSLAGPIFKEVDNLFANICKQCDEINAGGHFHITYIKPDIQPRNLEQVCTIGQDRVSMSAVWYKPYASSLEDAFLGVREFDQQLARPHGYNVIFANTSTLKDTRYLPEVSRTLEYGWKLKQVQESYMCTSDLAAKILNEFLDLLERDRTGKIRRKMMY